MVPGTVDKTITYLVAAFQKNNRNNPRVLANGKDDFLKAILCSFKNYNRKEKQQKYATAEVLAYLFSKPKEGAIAQYIANICNGA